MVTPIVDWNKWATLSKVIWIPESPWGSFNRSLARSVLFIREERPVRWGWGEQLRLRKQTLQNKHFTAESEPFPSTTLRYVLYDYIIQKMKTKISRKEWQWALFSQKPERGRKIIADSLHTWRPISQSLGINNKLCLKKWARRAFSCPSRWSQGHEGRVAGGV